MFGKYKKSFFVEDIRIYGQYLWTVYGDTLPN